VCLAAWLATPAVGNAGPPTPAPTEGEATVVPEPDPAAQPQTLLLGIIVNGREVAVADVYWDGEDYQLPVEQLLGFCECEGSLVTALSESSRRSVRPP